MAGFTSGKAALVALREREFDLCLVDLMMPDMDGIALLAAAQAIDPHMVGIIMMRQGAVETAVEAMQAGAFDYVVKPLQWQTLIQTLSRARDVRRLRRENVQLREEVRQAEEKYRSERKRTEEELQRQREALHQTEKLSAMGSLLAGVADELNNPLSVVLGQTALLSQLTTGSPLAVRAEKISRAAERCARIVKSFLALAWQRPPERQNVHLNQIVRETMELLSYQLRVDNVEVEFDLPDAIPPLWADPHQLHQMVINLISNAHQALRETPARRRITITTRFDPLQARVSLAVAYTGPGIPLSLELSICKGLINNHGGFLWVEPPLLQGVGVFHVELPVQTPPLDVSAAPATDAPASSRGRAILVVDDAPEIADVLAEMLTLDGHEVETAANGVVALHKLQERDYDLILSDLQMPELDGPGLYKELERSHPDLLRRIIFVTGYTLSPESRTFLERTRASVLSKPFRREQLRQVVQKVLQGIGNSKE